MKAKLFPNPIGLISWWVLSRSALLYRLVSLWNFLLTRSLPLYIEIDVPPGSSTYNHVFSWEYGILPFDPQQDAGDEDGFQVHAGLDEPARRPSQPHSRQEFFHGFFNSAASESRSLIGIIIFEVVQYKTAVRAELTYRYS